MDKNKVGNFIMMLRKERDLTQQALADLLHVSNKTISKWETGRGLPDISMLEPLSEVLGVGINELLLGEKIDKQLDEKQSDYLIKQAITIFRQQEVKRKNNIISMIIICAYITALIGLRFLVNEAALRIFFGCIGMIVLVIGWLLLYIWHKKLWLIGICLSMVISLFMLDKSIYKNSLLTLNTIDPVYAITSQIDPFESVIYLPGTRMLRCSKADYTQDIEFNYNNQSSCSFLHTWLGNTFRTWDLGRYTKYQSTITTNDVTNKYRPLIYRLPSSESIKNAIYDFGSGNLIISYSKTYDQLYRETIYLGGNIYVEEYMYIERSLVFNSMLIFLLTDNVDKILYEFEPENPRDNKYRIVAKREKYLEFFPSFDTMYTDIDEENWHVDTDKVNNIVDRYHHSEEFVIEMLENCFD